MHHLAAALTTTATTTSARSEDGSRSVEATLWGFALVMIVVTLILTVRGFIIIRDDSGTT